MYCAIIGDIVDSKKIVDRQAVQDHFRQTLDAVNREYDAYLASDLTVTLGDECQGLMNVHHLWYEVIQKIREAMAPTRMLFGVGVGEMATRFEKHTSIGADGQPYWYARRMLDGLKNGKSRTKNRRSIRYQAGEDDDRLVNALLSCIETLQSGRTDKQIEAVKAMARYQSQEAAAEKLGINQSAVSQRLQSAYYYQVGDAERNLIAYLKDRQY